MKYQIIVYYQTGDSFHTEDTETVLDPRWENLDIAKENLERIKQHHEYYHDHNNSFKLRYKKKALEEKWKNVPDFIVVEKTLSFPMIKIKLDNENEMQMWPMWCGYFERLYGAEIQIDYDKSGMRFDVGNGYY
jgi:hypothetical protein